MILENRQCLKAAYSSLRLIGQAALLGLFVSSGLANSAPSAPPRWDGTLGSQSYPDFFAVDIAVTPSGDFYYTDHAQRSVFRFGSDGKQQLKITGFPAFVRGINLDEDGRIYVGANPKRDIQIFNSKGVLVDTWRNVGDVNGEGFWKDGLLYLGDGNQVILLDRSGTIVRRFSGTGTAPGRHTNLGDIAVASNGDVWTVNRYPARVQKFSSKGEFKLAFGSQGAGQGQFNNPKGIGIDSKDNIYILDRRNYRVQKFNGEGKFLASWGSKGTGPGQFFESHGLFVAADDTVWVAGYHAHSIQQFDSQGTLLKFFQGKSPGGNLTLVTGLAVMDDVVKDGISYDRILYAVDKQNNRVLALDPVTGKERFQFGMKGQGRQTVFNFPRAICAGPDRALYISDDGHTRRIAPDGTFLDIYSYRDQTGGRIIGASGIGLTNAGVLYQANEGRGTVFAIDTKPVGGILLKESLGGSAPPAKFVTIRSLAVGGNLLYVADRGAHAIKVYSPSLDFQRVLNGMVPQASGLAVVPKDDVIYAGSNGRVRAFDLNGRELFTFGSPGTGEGQFGRRISAIAVDSEGIIYAADTFQGRIHRFRYGK